MKKKKEKEEEEEEGHLKCPSIDGNHGALGVIKSSDEIRRE